MIVYCHCVISKNIVMRGPWGCVLYKGQKELCSGRSNLAACYTPSRTSWSAMGKAGKGPMLEGLMMLCSIKPVCMLFRCLDHSTQCHLHPVPLAQFIPTHAPLCFPREIFPEPCLGWLPYTILP